MKRLIVILFFVILMAKVPFCQNNNYTHLILDSAHINYVSLCDSMLDVSINITDQMISFYKTDGHLIIPLYQTSDKDTLATLRECIEALSYTNPVYDTNEYIIDDCRPCMIISFYSGTDIYNKYYIHDYKALFPFAYAELYHIIISIIATHLKRK